MSLTAPPSDAAPVDHRPGRPASGALRLAAGLAVLIGILAAVVWLVFREDPDYFLAFLYAPYLIPVGIAIVLYPAIRIARRRGSRRSALAIIGFVAAECAILGGLTGWHALERHLDHRGNVRAAETLVGLRGESGGVRVELRKARSGELPVAHIAVPVDDSGATGEPEYWKLDCYSTDVNLNFEPPRWDDAGSGAIAEAYEAWPGSPASRDDPGPACTLDTFSAHFFVPLHR